MSKPEIPLKNKKSITLKCCREKWCFYTEMKLICPENKSLYSSQTAVEQPDWFNLLAQNFAGRNFGTSRIFGCFSRVCTSLLTDVIPHTNLGQKEKSMFSYWKFHEDSEKHLPQA